MSEKKCKQQPNDPQIILCWSGEIGSCVAHQLKEWLCEVHAGFKPFHSEDIPKGDVWWIALKKQLAQVKAAIVCLTPATVGSPWLHYEAGHLAGALSQWQDRSGESRSEQIEGQNALESRRVFPFLFRVQRSQLEGPLSAYQATLPNPRDIHLLLQSLAQLFNPPLQLPKRDVWSSLKDRLATIPHEGIGEIFPSLEKLFRRKTFDEPLDECVSQKWKERYAGARLTLERLQDRRKDVDDRAAPYVAQCYDDLIKALDYYTDAVGTEFLREKCFKTHNKRLRLYKNMVSEDRRRDVRDKLVRVLEPLPHPVLEPQARRYEKYRIDSEDGGVHLWQSVEAALISDNLEELGITSEELKKCGSSPWSLDRIVWYMAVAHNYPEAAELTLVAAIEREIEIIEMNRRLSPTPPDPRPLHFALWALGKRPELGCPVDEAGNVLERTLRLAKKLSNVDQDEATAYIGQSLLEKVTRVRKLVVDSARKSSR